MYLGASWCALICRCLCGSEGCGLSAVVNWPSGLRRQFKALVRKGVGSNPTLASCCFPLSLDLSSTLMLIKGVIHYEMYPRTVVSVNRFVLTSGRLLHPGSSLQRILLPMSTFTSLYFGRTSYWDWLDTNAMRLIQFFNRTRCQVN